MILIRRVVPEEAGVLSQIAIAAKRHWNYPERWMEIWTPQLTFSPEYFEAYESWAAEQDDILVAFHTLQVRDGIAWIENMWVLPEYMGKGVGRQLFLHALELSRQRGCKSLRLEADPNAVGYYEKMGMSKIGEHLYELDGQPRILPLMEITL
jgi:GNAT superfamily N-acetyltransferase